MNLLEIRESEKPNKKLTAIFLLSNGRHKTIHFGAKKNGEPMDDYTITGDKEQRARYIARHEKEDWTNPLSAAALSRYILWGDSKSRRKNIIAFIKMFNL